MERLDFTFMSKWNLFFFESTNDTKSYLKINLDIRA